MTVTQTDSTTQAYTAPDAALADEHSRVAVYLEFLYGFGAAPGIDLGAPLAYSRIGTANGTVYRQEFERGVTIANIGNEAVEVALDPPLYDLRNAKQASIHLPGHSAEVLVSAPRVAAPRRPS
jgi:hypothetical protein